MVSTRVPLAAALLVAILGPLLLASTSVASTIQRDGALERRASSINYTDPNDNGGQMKTIIPELDGLGEPLNVIVSGLSDASVLNIDGFLLWATSVHFGVSCLGQANGTEQRANLGGGVQIQGTGNGDNGVLRWNYYSPYVGTCKETVDGGNHFRWFKQASSNAWFLATSVEMDLSTSHMIATDGYNRGRDYLVGNATFTNGTEWEGNLYNTTVDWIPAGVLQNATSDGFNHPQVALAGQPVQDGRVALLTIRQLKSGSSSNSATTAMSQLTARQAIPILGVIALSALFTLS